MLSMTTIRLLDLYKIDIDTYANSLIEKVIEGNQEKAIKEAKDLIFNT